ncbi:FAD/NAD(P)-binding protein [Cupriavidus plantarum]|uniref:FAD/NAD(P)-binding protein n=1 Tax=Cupriavidus plantarum TaxID=942865 RepID=UPI0015C6E2E7|nr:FAD/NAD(P)-binding protein [Cupriavidus plantarum]NYI00364.1 putative NAD(P)/FAD-binding protein YdhS [Cupriavidus plantarum]
MSTHSIQTTSGLASAPAPRIAIVGGGFAGVAVALRLLRQSPVPVHIDLIDPAETPGLGVAYATTLPHHLINGISKMISLFDDEPGHFTDWLARQVSAGVWAPPEGIALGDSLPPRQLYGAYLQETWALHTGALREGFALEHLRARATGLQRVGKSYVVTLGDGRRRHADKVVLATGLMPRRAADLPFAIDDAALRSPAYVHDQWAPGAFDGIEGGQRIVYLGAGLSALDGLISAEHAGFRGEHVAISRRGLAVNERRALEPWPDFFEIPEQGLTLRALLRQVHPQLRRLRAEGQDWQRIVPTLRLHVDTLWARALAAERRRFVRTSRSVWDVSLHRSAPVALAWQTRVKADGRYRHEAGQLLAVEALPDGRLAVRWRERGGAAVHTLEADRVVNCLGFEYDWRRSDDPLSRDVLARGLVQPDPLGFGLQASRDTCALLDANGYPQEGLHAVGHPLRGVFWESNAVTEHIPQVGKVARALIAQLASASQATGAERAAA